MGVILLVIAILVLINGFFAASEMALVSLTSSDLHKIETEGHKNSKVLRKVTKDSTKYLSTIQVAITFSGFLSSAFAGSEIAGPLRESLLNINIDIPFNVIVIIITILLSFFTLVFGELVPKRIAMNRTKKLALFTAPIINIVMNIFRPFVWLLTKTTNGVVRLLGFKSNKDNDAVTEQEIKELIVYGHVKGLYQLEERNMLERIFTLDDITASMIMTTKKNVVGLDISKVTEDSYHQIIHSRYSRIPIYDTEIDNIVGVIHIKDILLQLDTMTLFQVDLRSLLRTPMFISGEENLNTLLKTMKDSNNHLAFIKNENDVLEGIVTLEDIVEEITGSIYDEHDILEKDMGSEFTYIVTGDMTIKEFNERLGKNVFHTNPKQTMNEYIQTECNELPELKKPIELLDKNIVIEVLSIEENKIKKARIIMKD